MEPGDVLLVDNYRALHGRDVFQGDRFHAVTWFTWDQNEEWRGDERRIVEKNAFNQAINKMMDWLPKDFESDGRQHWKTLLAKPSLWFSQALLPAFSFQ